VALVCTSGTAAANYLPAILESHHAGVPLLVITADRPPELREWGAGQTVDQIKLYGGNLRWFVELPVLEAGRWALGEAVPSLRYARSLACRAIAESRAGWPGPVHLNCPLREPLQPEALLEPERSSPPEVGTAVRAYAGVEAPPARLQPEQLADLVSLAASCVRGLIVCGPMDPTPDAAGAIAELARWTGWPIFADPTSQLRRGPHVTNAPILGHADLLLRDEGFAAAQVPECVVRIGGSPVSKAYRLWLEGQRPEHLVLVDSGGEWSEPSHMASAVLRVDFGELCRSWSQALADRPGSERASGWTETWLAADARVAAALSEALTDELELRAPRAVRELCHALPDGACLYVSNSMAVRYLDAFLPVSPRPLRVLSNRGANGIDGTVSSALGAAVAGVEPTVLLTGDLAFLHDLGGLLAARRYAIDLTIVVLNDDGGGIFSYLPIAGFGEEVGFEELFETPQGLDLSRLVPGFDLQFERATSWEHLRATVKEATAFGGCWVIEVPIDRGANTVHFRSLVALASRAGAKAAATETSG